MTRNKLKTFLLTLLVVSAFSTSVFATDGYFRHGYGIRYSALAGSGVAVSLSSLGATTNPAGLSFLPTRYDANISLFSPSRDYTVDGNPSMFPGTFGLAPGTIAFTEIALALSGTMAFSMAAGMNTSHSIP